MAKFPFSRLGFGCYALGGAYGKRIDSSQAIKIIRLAFALGIRFFDTADSYGTEEILGQAVFPFRQEVAIATKVGGDCGLGRKAILASCEASLKRMGADYIDLYQIHYDDPDHGVAEVVEALELLKSHGKIRHYGIGHLPLPRTKEYLTLGRPLTVLAEMNVAALNRYLELRPQQKFHDFGLIAFSVTGRGLLTGPIPPSFAPADIRRLDPFFRGGKLAHGLAVKDKLAEIARELNASPAQVAIAWVLGKPGVVAALTGPTDPRHLRENCAALGLELGPYQEEIDKFIQREGELLRTRLAQEILAILQNPITDVKGAKEDLVYLLEHCIEENLIPYPVGVALFTKLLSLEDNQGAIKDLQAIKDQAREQIVEKR